MLDPAGASYGADASGLICGYRFGADGIGVPVEGAQALQWLAQSAPDEGFVWLHLNLAHAADIIAGLLGMDVGGVPLAEHPWGFWIVVSVILVFTAVAGVVAVLRRRDR